jgi:hypothetical protein
MKLSIKIALLTAILAADLTFFLFFRTYLPQQYNLVFHSLPWSDNLEKTVAVIIGLATALLTALSISNLIVKRLFKSLERG